MRANKRRLIVALSVAVLVSIGAYYLINLGRSRTVPTPQSSAGPVINSEKLANKTAGSAGLKSAEAPTVPSAGKGLHASFDELRGCYYASRELAAGKRSADCSFLQDKPEYERQYASCLDNWVNAHDRMSAAQERMAGCGNDHDLLKHFYDSTKATAKSGNPDAQLCYLASDFVDTENRQHYTDADIEEYKAAAPRYIADSLKRGDWRVVFLLTTHPSARAGGLSVYIPDIGQPQTMYKMDRLLSLRADAEYANELADSMKTWAGSLSKSQIADADEWAQQTYTQYFASSPILTKAPEICRTGTDQR